MLQGFPHIIHFKRILDFGEGQQALDPNFHATNSAKACRNFRQQMPPVSPTTALMPVCIDAFALSRRAMSRSVILPRAASTGSMGGMRARWRV
jgi:hypothetical protein